MRKQLLFLVAVLVASICHAQVTGYESVIRGKRIPQGLSITSVTKNVGCPPTCTGVIIDWSAPTVDQYGHAVTISEYRVYRGLLARRFRAQRLIATVSAPTTIYTDTTAFDQINSQEVSYFYKVYAVSDLGTADWWHRTPKDRTVKIQWTGTGCSSYGEFALSRRDYPEENIEPGGNRLDSCQTLFDVENFELGAANESTALVLKYAEERYSATVSHLGKFISKGYALDDDSNDAVNTPAAGTVASVPAPSPSRVGDVVTLTWSAASGTGVASYRVYRNLYHAGPIGSSLVGATAGLTIDDDISDLDTGDIAVWSVVVVYTDGAVSEHSANSTMVTK